MQIVNKIHKLTKSDLYASLFLNVALVTMLNKDTEVN